MLKVNFNVVIIRPTVRLASSLSPIWEFLCSFVKQSKVTGQERQLRLDLTGANTHTHTINIIACCVCQCMCVYVRERERGRERPPSAITQWQIRTETLC